MFLNKTILLALLSASAHASVTVLVSPTGAATPSGAYIKVDIRNCANPTVLNSGYSIPLSRQFPLNKQSSIQVTVEDNVSQISCNGNQLSYYTFSYVANGVTTAIKSVELPAGNFALSNLANLTVPPWNPGVIQGPPGIVSVINSGSSGMLNSIICSSGCTVATDASGNATLTITGIVGLMISSFSGFGGSVEIGTTVTNPAITATYAGTPTSAIVTNSDNIGSPLTLSAPYTSGTITGSFTHNTTASVIATLTANGSVTATQSLTWKPAIFGGVGATGATGTVTASGANAVLSTSDVLSRAQLGIEANGTVFGPYTASNQAVYLLLAGSAHSFIDTASGLPFAFNTPIPVSFVNVNGVTVTMYLYASSNPLYGTFNIRVAG